MPAGSSARTVRAASPSERWWPYTQKRYIRKRNAVANTSPITLCGDVICQECVEAEEVVGDVQAEQADSHADDGDGAELEQLERHILPAVFAEGPQAIAEPAGERRDGDGGDLRTDRTLEEVLVAQHAESQDIEDSHIDAVADQPDQAELESRTNQLPIESDQRSCES